MIEHRATGQGGAADPAVPTRVRLTGVETLSPGTTGASWRAVRLVPERLVAPGGRIMVERERLPRSRAQAMAAARAAVLDRPEVLLHVSACPSATALRVETTAVDPDACQQEAPTGLRDRAPRPPCGPAELRARWLASAMVGRLRAAGHRVELSDTAGSCEGNAALYAALKTAQDRDGDGRAPLIGLVHVPPPQVMAPGVASEVLTDLLVELSDQTRRARCAEAGWSRLSVGRGRRALRVGLTGGIGAGKSTVARLLRARGAHVVDADAIAREILAPGAPALAAVAEAFGPRVMAADGALDRAALAEIVFSDPSSRARLEALTLPRVAEAAAERMERHGRARVAVYDVPLLTEGAMADLFDCVVVVEAPLEARLSRLAGRGTARAQARERMANQASDAQRRAVADVVVSNGSSPADLVDAVDRLWEHLTGG